MAEENDPKAEAEKESEKRLKRLLELEEKMNEVTDERIRLNFQFHKSQGDVNSARQEASKLLKILDQQQGAYTAQQIEYIELLEKGNDLTEQEREQRQKLIESIGDEVYEMERLHAIRQEAEEYLKEKGKIYKNDQKLVDDFSKSLESLTLGFLKMDGGLNHSITKAGEFVKRFAEARDMAQAFRESFGKVFTMANIMAGVFDTVKNATIKMATEFDSASAEFSKATGLANQYNDVLFNVQKTQNQFGITAADAGQSMQALLANFSEFHSSSQDVQQSLSAGVAQLGKLGVSADETSKLMQTLSKTINISGKQSLQMAKEVGMMGVNIGISTKKMLSDYNASLKTLAVYGEKSVEVFTGIAAAAKAAGVETGVLLGLAEKFDTFAGAAETTGKLNALLGSQLSATEMLLMTEDERLKTMISTVQATGQSFASMDKFTQKAIANAAGISDMAEANKIFGMSLSEYESYEQQMAASTKAQEKLEEAMKAAIPFTQKLQIMAAELAAAFLPVLEGMHVVLDFVTSGFVSLNKTTNGFLGTIVGGIAGLYLFLAGMGGLGNMIKVAAGLLKIFNFGIIKSIALKIKDKLATLGLIATKEVEEVLDKKKIKTQLLQEKLKRKQIKNQQLMNKTAKSGAGSMLALGAAIMMIGAGIGAAAYGMAHFVKAFAGFSAGEILAVSFAIGVFAAAITLMILTLMAFVSGPQAIVTGLVVALLLSVGAAAMMIGEGIKRATDGMDKFTNSLANLKEMSVILEALTGAKEVAVSVVMNKNLDNLRKFLNDVKNSDVKSELENLALITTGVSANMMTENTVANVSRIENLAKEIKNVFKPQITVKIEGDDVKKLFKEGVFKTSGVTG